VTGSFWWDLLIGVAAALLLAWLALMVVLLVARPRGGLLREALRLLPDVLRLVRRLAADKTLPCGVRIRLALLLAYLAIPLDPIPDFIPVLAVELFCTVGQSKGMITQFAALAPASPALRFPLDRDCRVLSRCAIAPGLMQRRRRPPRPRT
jgi:hypothetical protein